MLKICTKIEKEQKALGVILNRTVVFIQPINEKVHGSLKAVYKSENMLSALVVLKETTYFINISITLYLRKQLSQV